MARSNRQSKILELINTYEIETQDELVSKLRALNFDITQATISRDIKELGLIKIISSTSGKYKYAIVDTTQPSNKYIILFKESTISIKSAQNLLVVKTLKGVAGSISSLVDKFNLDGYMGCVNGDDTVMLIFADSISALKGLDKLNSIINN